LTKIVKIIAALSVPLLLSGCLLLPGKFNASLKLMQGGLYEFSYVGEMQIFAGDEKDMAPPEKRPFDPNNARCSDWIDADGTVSPSSHYDRFRSDSKTEDAAFAEAEAEIAADVAQAAAMAAAEGGDVTVTKSSHRKKRHKIFTPQKA